ncbi:hypothetical protein PY254_11570 [Rhodanobacter sp. AS-Z3]|uniref:hypothetical protein n=1 Tax=Rhodanobacter sp. AS-Z3 TaxID=3031330 RepID=UPI00247AFC88|nr:hypothetical protein [Rhodanobacter sp. AS-Z3]WEN13880.1 hypothetical protein PY254_11570 [Rhodanobacter sp. AS-Z3]
MVTILLQPSAKGSWRIRRSHITLFSDLPLGPAIKLASEIARDEYYRLGAIVCVQMMIPGSTVVLSSHPRIPATACRETNRPDALAA